MNLFYFPGALWKISPIFGILATAAELAGFNLFSIWRDITGPSCFEYLQEKNLTPQEVNDIGQQQISAHASLKL